MKRWLYMIAAVVFLVLVIAGIKTYSVMKTIEYFKSQGAPKATVSAANVAMTPWLPTVSAVGSLHAVRGADLSAEVAGIVASIDFESGQDVNTGKLLVRLRSTDDLARLQSLKASAALAQTLYTRDQAQFEAQAISQATLDADSANLKATQAQVDEQQAIAAKKFIHAPFAGRVGIRSVDPGQFVAAGAKLVTLQALDPIYVDFYLPQQNMALVAIGQKVTIGADVGEKSLPGTVEAINPQVDIATRNVQVRATLHNPGLKLLPGMYVNVTVDVGAPRSYLTLPQSALTYDPYGASVYLIKPNPKAPGNLIAQRQFVVTGQTRGDQVAILSGLAEGDRVVTSGQLKLKSGDTVVVDNSVTPSNDKNPTPENQ